MSFIKVKDLKPLSYPGINIIIRIIGKGEPRTVNTKYGKSRVCDFKVGDETGISTLSLWGSKIDEVKFGEILELKEGYCNVWQGKPQLSLGKNGTMTIINDDKFPSVQSLLNKLKEENVEED